MKRNLKVRIKMHKKKDMMGVIATLSIMGIFATALYGGWVVFQDWEDDEDIVVTGEIIKVEYIEYVDKYGDVLNLTFDSGDWFHVYVYKDMDFTANSKFILRMKRDNRWDTWIITKMYKIPD